MLSERTFDNEGRILMPAHRKYMVTRGYTMRPMSMLYNGRDVTNKVNMNRCWHIGILLVPPKSQTLANVPIMSDALTTWQKLTDIRHIHWCFFELSKNSQDNEISTSLHKLFSSHPAHHFLFVHCHLPGVYEHRCLSGQTNKQLHRKGNSKRRSSSDLGLPQTWD